MNPRKCICCTQDLQKEYENESAFVKVYKGKCLNLDCGIQTVRYLRSGWLETMEYRITPGEPVSDYIENLHCPLCKVLLNVHDSSINQDGTIYHGTCSMHRCEVVRVCLVVREQDMLLTMSCDTGLKKRDKKLVETHVA